MEYILGYDCDGNEIYEYRVLRAIWSNDIDIKDLEDADPRQYCAIVSDDEIAYAISVYDWWNSDLIRKKEEIKETEEIPIVVKPINEMVNYEVATCSEGDFYYDLNRNELKKKLNEILNKDHNKVKKLVNNKGVDPNE